MNEKIEAAKTLSESIDLYRKIRTAAFIKTASDERREQILEVIDINDSQRNLFIALLSHNSLDTTTLELSTKIASLAKYNSFAPSFRHGFQAWPLAYELLDSLETLRDKGLQVELIEEFIVLEIGRGKFTTKQLQDSQLTIHAPLSSDITFATAVQALTQVSYGNSFTTLPMFLNIDLNDGFFTKSSTHKNAVFIDSQNSQTYQAAKALLKGTFGTSIEID
jgi:hypothetical protein